MLSSLSPVEQEHSKISDVGLHTFMNTLSCLPCTRVSNTVYEISDDGGLQVWRINSMNNPAHAPVHVSGTDTRLGTNHYTS